MFRPQNLNKLEEIAVPKSRSAERTHASSFSVIDLCILKLVQVFLRSLQLLKNAAFPNYDYYGHTLNVISSQKLTYENLLTYRLQDMATLMYKVKNNICPKYIADLFRRSDTKYALRNKEFVIPRFNTATYGKHSIRYTGPRLWNIVPKNIRELPTLSSFKINIRKIDLNTLLTDNYCTNCILCST